MTWSIVARDEEGPDRHRRLDLRLRGRRPGALRRDRDRRDRDAVLREPLLRLSRSRPAAAGASAKDVVRILTAADEGRSQRQVHVMDRAGRFAAYTGEGCVEWCGHLVRDTFSVAGNMLAGPR